jgi:3-phenylpropionate/cinnamic acid dioxygenase small subunit
MSETATLGAAAVPATTTSLPPELLPFPDRGPRRPDLDAPLSQFMIEEAAALDEGRYEEWLGYLTEEFIYQVPVPLLREDPALPRHSDGAVLFEATKRVLELKLGRVGLRHAWSDRPGGVMRHFISGTRVFGVDQPGSLRVDSNVMAAFNRGREESALATAARQDIVRPDGAAGYRLVRRRVLLDIEVPTHTQLSIIF